MNDFQVMNVEGKVVVFEGKKFDHAMVRQTAARFRELGAAAVLFLPEGTTVDIKSIDSAIDFLNKLKEKK